MTDDEVKQWLSEDEREAFDAVMPTRPALRSLAETRKALASVPRDGFLIEPLPGDGTDAMCISCDLPEGVGHSAHCPFHTIATMPGPK